MKFLKLILFLLVIANIAFAQKFDNLKYTFELLL